MTIAIEVFIVLFTALLNISFQQKAAAAAGFYSVIE